MTYTLPVLECKRCGARWSPRKPEAPVRCAKCKSPYWNRERKMPALRNEPHEPGDEL